MNAEATSNLHFAIIFKHPSAAQFNLTSTLAPVTIITLFTIVLSNQIALYFHSHNTNLIIDYSMKYSP